MNNHYKNEREIEAVVEGFEDCITGKDDFSHRAHITVAAWYLLKSDREEALRRMREGLLRFLGHHQIDRAIYKEKLTAAWIDLINHTISELDPALSLTAITNIVVEQLEHTRLPEDDNPVT
jgi:hypothetical protein